MGMEKEAGKAEETRINVDKSEVWCMDEWTKHDWW
jgi:hypothetical protein